MKNRQTQCFGNNAMQPVDLYLALPMSNLLSLLSVIIINIENDKKSVFFLPHKNRGPLFRPALQIL